MAAKKEIVSSPSAGLDAGREAHQQRSTVVRGGAFVFVSGLSAVDPKTGMPTPGTTQSETQQILANLKQLLESAGSSMEKVVKVTVLLHSMLEMPNMNEVYATFFSERPPARTVCGARLPDGVKVIIEATALAWGRRT